MLTHPIQWIGSICKTVAKRGTMMVDNSHLGKVLMPQLDINGIRIGDVETLRWLERHARASGQQDPLHDVLPIHVPYRDNLPSSKTKHIVTVSLSDNTTQATPSYLVLNCECSASNGLEKADDIVVMTRAPSRRLCSALWRRSLHCLQLSPQNCSISKQIQPYHIHHSLAEDKPSSAA